MNNQALREKMVETQLIPRGIEDPRVINAFRTLERHKFVPGENSKYAYEDYPLSIGSGQTISQPYMAALMTQLLELKGGEKVLEIGSGSGYQAAILSKLCREVYTVERDARLFSKTKSFFENEGYNNIFIKHGDGTLGWEEHSPFDGIIVTAASPDIPGPLKKQMKDGGRLVIPAGSLYTQTLYLLRKEDDQYFVKNVTSCVFVPLVGEHGWTEPR